jgi:hypothetical protein
LVAIDAGSQLARITDAQKRGAEIVCHYNTQCASSTTTGPMRCLSPAAKVSMSSGFVNCSGVTNTMPCPSVRSDS